MAYVNKKIVIPTPNWLPVRGPLGEAIHRTTQRLGIPECGGCGQRRQQLNRVVLQPRGKK